MWWGVGGWIQAQAQNKPHNKWESEATENEKRYTKSLQAVSDPSESLSTQASPALGMTQ